MNRDKARMILGEGATEEQITNLLNEFHNAEKEKNDKIAQLEVKLNNVSDYDDLKAKLDAIELANMTDQQKLEADKLEIEKNLKNSRIIVNTAKAKEILAGEIVDENLLQKLVTDDEATTIANANLFKQTLTNLKESVEKQTRESLSTADLKPGITNVTQGEEKMTFDKFSKLSASEQEKFINEHPEEFENL
jgi:hypothetical protein